MKILITLASLEIGGAETHVAELVSELARRGYDVIVASGGGVYAEQLAGLDIKHYTVPLSRRSIKDMLVSRKMLKQIIRAEKPDIIHAHARIPAFLVNSLRRCADFVFVTTVHGAFDTSFVLRHLSGWGSKTLAVSDDLKQYLLENYKVSPENIYTSINGINTEKFNKNISGDDIVEEFGLADSSNRICFVSRLSEDICACAGILIEKFPYITEKVPDAQLIIVGDGELFGSLQKKAQKVNSLLGRQSIILTGGRTDVNRIIATAKVCVGVSRAILEPMAMEKLCLVAGNPGYIGIITPENLEKAINCNFTCRGCAPLNEDTLADDVIKLLCMPEEEAFQLRAFAGEVIKEKYSIHTMVSDNEKMYHDALRQHGNDAAVLGYYGYGNCGDDALLSAILSDITRLRPFFSPTVLSFRPQVTAADYGVKAINRFNVFKIAGLFRKTKLFIAGGGSLVQDVTSTKSLLYYLMMILLACRYHKPVMLYGNGIGPINKKINRKLAAYVLNKVKVITLRDYDSLKLLDDMGVTRPLIKITADPALGLTCKDTSAGEKILSGYGVDPSVPFFCLSVRKWRSMGTASDAFARICRIAYEKYSLLPVVLPMQYSKDIQISLEVAQKAGCPCVVINESLSADRILAVLDSAQCAVAVRLHMLIFGTLLGKPVLGVDYDPKVSSFMRFSGQDCCLTEDSLKNGTFEKSAEAFFENYKDLAAGLEKQLPSFKAAAFENARIAVELMENE